MTRVVAARLTPEAYERLEKLAAAKMETVSGYAARVLVDHVQERETE